MKADERRDVTAINNSKKKKLFNLKMQLNNRNLNITEDPSRSSHFIHSHRCSNYSSMSGKKPTSESFFPLTFKVNCVN